MAIGFVSVNVLRVDGVLEGSLRDCGMDGWRGGWESVGWRSGVVWFGVGLRHICCIVDLCLQVHWCMRLGGGAGDVVG